MSLASTLRPESYEEFAFLYSRTMAEDFCRRAFPLYRELLHTDLQPCCRMLDICCGSGQLAREFTAFGHRVTGFDSSREMIRLARSAAPSASFFVGDARNFHLTHKFSAALSSFNSLAHATQVEDLLKIFACTRQALAPGAAFVFDVSMEEAYRSRWHGTFSLAVEEFTFTVEPSFDSQTRIACNKIRVFNRKAAGYENCFSIYQRCHTENDLREMLQLARFREVESWEAEDQLGMADERGRRFFRCR
ncbi:MAG TPA: class I SAM-dependent methyltransferase [Terriglobales bacterium]|nr:class I SAM-dependent methyltransferase [Terriglobales bacterium]